MTIKIEEVKDVLAEYDKQQLYEIHRAYQDWLSSNGADLARIAIAQHELLMEAKEIVLAFNLSEKHDRTCICYYCAHKTRARAFLDKMKEGR